MSKNKKMFLVERTETHYICRIFGIKLSIRDRIREYKETKASKFIQDTLDLSKLRNSKKIVVFLTPCSVRMCGGVMSIFSLCETLRNVNDQIYCILSTFPNGNTYVINDKFYNNEKVLRFDQVVENARQVEEMILHIPEYYAGNFYKDLNKKDIKFLKSISNLQINIMNQNIEMMPEPEKLQDLYKLTENITQTIAHNRYATQEICNKWQIPTHLFSALWDMSSYKKYSFEDKQKIIVLSPDKNDYKESIVTKLKNELNDWEFVTVKNLTFSQYMDLISKAYFVISFGEGFDGYFLQPAIVNSIGISAYNDKFFPNSSWKNLNNVFDSYEDMSESIVGFIKEYSQNSEKYLELSVLNKQKHDEVYNFEQYKDNLKRFYEKKYDFLPQMEVR